MRTVFWGAAAAAAALLLVLLAIGWRPVVLLSDSMAPGAPSGSLLVARPVAPGSVVPGDVVTVPTAAGGRVTHRVLAVERLDGDRWARLQGDANPTPDPGRVRLPAPTLRTVAVVPGLGALVTGDGHLVLVGLGLLVLGVAGLAALRTVEPGARPTSVASTGDPSVEDAVDPRVEVLAATLEALAEDGMAPAHLDALARVRTAALLGLGDVEQDVTAVDVGARFVLVALADADPAALSLVPPTDGRAVGAHGAVARWWDAIDQPLPPRVRAVLDDARTGAVTQAGVTAASPVD